MSSDLSLQNRLTSVQQKIRAAAQKVGRDPSDVRLLAVTKNMSADTVSEACALGLVRFGENRVQEARDKIPLVRGDAKWHLIGHLQTNKVRQALRLFELIHSLDRLSLAREIQRVADRRDLLCAALVQVNVSGEDTKHGVSPQALFELLREIDRFDRIRVCGLMTMAPYTDDMVLVRSVFRDLRLLAEKAAQQDYSRTTMEHLSMGMTADYEIAIEEGATIVRVGSALFGPRPAAK